jgi:hypothetical protein
MALQPVTRPALIAHNPQRIREAVRPWGISIRTLALDAYRGTLTIPPTTPPLIFDLRGLTITEAARQLCAMQLYQRQTRIVPHVLVDQSMRAVQRLIVGCADLKTIVVDPEPIETLIRWLWAPVDLAPQQVWVNIDQPDALTRRPYLPQLLAALDHAVSIEHAAMRCAIAPNTAYRMLHECCGETPSRQSVAGWHTALVTALGSRESA